MAASYFEQSRGVKDVSLLNALRLAKQATTNSPDFGFAWERVAELGFSFGRTKETLQALDKSLSLAPQNPQALALKGFVFSSQNRSLAARECFDLAIAGDAALGNAWLGRGLVRIRLGDTRGGREDLLMAAALEPQRAELRSYLGKAYAYAGDGGHATKELALAKKLDPNDPTAWLYSALLNQQDNQINDAIRDLEKSQTLNDNRSVYRSQLLLDEDHAVRSANLAAVYLDAGMTDVSLREAGRAVSSDYANYSAHLFLANSYEQLRDPNWSNLRYDTPATEEYWIANLLAPTGAGWLSSTISQQPYARLFDQNRFGFNSEMTYLGRDAWAEQADGYYTSGSFSCDVATGYRYDPGQRPNNDFENREFDVNLKGQLTEQDNVFASIQLAYINYGDNNQYYNSANVSPDFRLNETQEPNLFLGYHHEWSPGVHTLFFATRRVADESASIPNAGQVVGWIYHGNFTAVHVFGDSEMVKLSPELYSTELQQIWEQADHTTILGTRYEWGDVHYQDQQSHGYNTALAIFPDPSGLLLAQDFKADVQHFNLYGYHTWQIADAFALTAGLSYDWLHQPADVATTPFPVNQTKTTVQFSPKAGCVWTPAVNTTFRVAYTRSLSGFIDGQSFRLEPTEVAGLNQSFRSLIPESVVGDTSGSKFDTVGVSLEQKFDSGTYLGLSGEILYSKLDDVAGAFIYNADLPGDYPTYTSGLRHSMNFRERSLLFTVNQLLGKQWSAGARYRLSQANLNLSYPDLNPAAITTVSDEGFHARQTLSGVLQTVNLHANWNHPSGLFSILEGNWYHQDNSGFSPAEPGDDFWQLNIYAGYRFWHRRAELTVGLLNIFDQNYRLEPLNIYNDMARNRTVLARLCVNF